MSRHEGFYANSHDWSYGIDFPKTMLVMVPNNNAEIAVQEKHREKRKRNHHTPPKVTEIRAFSFAISSY